MPKARHGMTTGHCIAQLELWGTGSLPAGPGQSPGRDKGAKSPENSENTAFYEAKNYPLLLFIFSYVPETNLYTENLKWTVPWLTSVKYQMTMAVK